MVRDKLQWRGAGREEHLGTRTSGLFLSGQDGVSSYLPDVRDP